MFCVVQSAMRFGFLCLGAARLRSVCQGAKFSVAKFKILGSAAGSGTDCLGRESELKLTFVLTLFEDLVYYVLLCLV